MNMQATLDISNERIQNAYRVLNAVGEKANSSGKSQLIEGDRYIDLYIHYDLEGDKKNTPVVVELKHSLFNAEDGDNAILIIGKNDTTTKDYLEEHPVPGVEKVTSMDKIRTTIATHQQKRDLLRLYKRFLCDAAILPMMPSILGNKCFKWNKQPFPVALKGTIEDNVKSALSSTQMLVNCGPIMSIRVGLESFTEDQIVENLNCVLPVLFKYIKPSNILSISLRKDSSMLIPIYQKPASELFEPVTEVKVKEEKVEEEKVEVVEEKKEMKPKKAPVEKKTKKAKKAN